MEKNNKKAEQTKLDPEFEQAKANFDAMQNYYASLGYKFTTSGQPYKPRGSWFMTENEYTPNNGIGKTVQGQSFTIDQLMQRHDQGMPIPEINNSGLSTDDIDSPDVTKILNSDLSEQQKFSEQMNQQNTDLKGRITKHQDDVKRAEALQQQQEPKKDEGTK